MQSKITKATAKNPIMPILQDGPNAIIIKQPQYLLYPNVPDIIRDRINSYLWHTSSFNSLSESARTVEIEHQLIWPGEKRPAKIKKNFQELIQRYKSSEMKGLYIDHEKAKRYGLNYSAGFIHVFESIILNHYNNIEIVFTSAFSALYKKVKNNSTEIGETITIPDSEFERVKHSSMGIRFAREIAKNQMVSNQLVLTIEEIVKISGYNTTKKITYQYINRPIIQQVQKCLKDTRWAFTYCIGERDSSGVKTVIFQFMSNENLNEQIKAKMATYKFEKHLTNMKVNPAIIDEIKTTIAAKQIEEGFVVFTIIEVYKYLLNKNHRSTLQNETKNNPAGVFLKALRNQWYAEQYKEAIENKEKFELQSPPPAFIDLEKGRPE